MHTGPDRTGPGAIGWVPYDKSSAGTQDDLALTWLRPLIPARTRAVLRVPSYAWQWRERRDALGAFARSATVVTDRARGTDSRAAGPTFVPWADDPEVIASSLWRARGQALALTEHPSLPLAAWAGSVRAIDIRTGAVTPDIRTPEQVRLLEHLAQSVYNGWTSAGLTSAPGSDTARWVLPQLVDTGMTWPNFVGSMIAVSPHHTDPTTILKVAPVTWRHQAAHARERLLDNFR